MNCIDEQLLQKYIDGECTENEKAVVKQHLSGCSVCIRKQVEMEKLSFGIKQSINSLTIEKIEIPTFKIKKTTSRKNFKIIIYSLSAACILLFILLFVDKKYEINQKQMTIVQSIPREIDANLPANQQDFVIEVFDGKGGCSEYLIE